jgi:hypothetical protein
VPTAPPAAPEELGLVESTNFGADEAEAEAAPAFADADAAGAF